jgi:hypothetical protein
MKNIAENRHLRYTPAYSKGDQPLSFGLITIYAA